MAYARGWGWSLPSGPHGARSDASDPGTIHGRESILSRFSSHIVKKNAPVLHPSSSRMRQTSSPGERRIVELWDWRSGGVEEWRMGEARISAIVLPLQGRVSGDHVPPIITSDQSRPEALISSTFF